MDQRDCVPNSSHVPLLLSLLLLIRCRKAYEPSFDCCSCRFASPSLPYFPDSFSRTVNDGKDAVNVSHDETTMIHCVSCDAAAGFTRTPSELTVWPLFRQ